ncbi:hypothetical protein BJ944DRAFT_272491 [Cunninghamella echinulata]|nr:hypothetical protein BJ944DRAFT_272491 [Cunninghamella echinulata]
MENQTIKKRGRPAKKQLEYKKLMEILDELSPSDSVPIELALLEGSPDEIELEFLVYRLKKYINDMEQKKKLLNKKKNDQNKKNNSMRIQLLYDKGYMETKLKLVERENNRLLKKLSDLNAFSSPPPLPLSPQSQYNFITMNNPTTTTTTTTTTVTVAPPSTLQTIKKDIIMEPSSPPPSSTFEIDDNNNDYHPSFSPHISSSPKINTPNMTNHLQSFKFAFSPLRYRLNEKNIKKNEPSSSSSF